MWKLTVRLTNQLIDRMDGERRRGRLVLMASTCYILAFQVVAVVLYALLVRPEFRPPSGQRVSELLTQVGAALLFMYGAFRLWIAHRQQRRSTFVIDLFGTGLLGMGHSLLVVLPDLMLRGPKTETYLGRFVLFYSWFIIGVLGTVILIVGMIAFVSRYETERSERHRLQALIRFTEHLSTGDEEGLLAEVTQQLQELLDADSTVLYLWDPAQELLVPVASCFKDTYDEDYIAQMRSFKVPKGFGGTGWVFETGKPHIMSNGEKDKHAQPLPGWGYEDKSGLAVPIGDGEALGVVRVMRGGANPLAREDADLASSFGRQAYLVLRHARAMRDLAELSITDHLTGLYNVRHLFTILERELDRARRYDQPLSVIMVDSDALKQVNDRLGHQQGDDHLRLIGAMLTESLRSSDWAFRYAGDEFVVVLPMTTPDDASVLGDRLRERIASAGTLPGVEPTISVGVAAFPLHAQTVQELLGAADHALYASKRGGKNRLTVAPQLRVAVSSMDPEPDEWTPSI
jgi:diguanylate cyclase (GGDEF)-like protein